MVVSTHLKNLSQIGSFPQVEVNIKKIFELPPVSIHLSYLEHMGYTKDSWKKKNSIGPARASRTGRATRRAAIFAGQGVQLALPGGISITRVHSQKGNEFVRGFFCWGGVEIPLLFSHQAPPIFTHFPMFPCYKAPFGGCVGVGGRFHRCKNWPSWNQCLKSSWDVQHSNKSRWKTLKQ